MYIQTKGIRKFCDQIKDKVNIVKGIEKTLYRAAEFSIKAINGYTWFVQYIYLHDINRDELPEDAVAKLPLAERLDFIKTAQNTIFSGNPGTGKTHLATALGILACQQGYRVLFTTVGCKLTTTCPFFDFMVAAALVYLNALFACLRA